MGMVRFRKLRFTLISRRFVSVQVVFTNPNLPIQKLTAYTYPTHSSRMMMVSLSYR